MVHNGVNLMRLPATDVYAYGLQLMDALFTREELSSSLLYRNEQKSKKDGLDPEKVSELFGE